MTRRDIIVVGASAGGVDALKRVVSRVPAGFHAAILVVLHLWSEGVSILPEILSRAGPLPAVHPSDGESIRYGHIYVAPPDYHLEILNSRLLLGQGPRENRHRPAADPLFRSAATEFGERVIGVVLTGSLTDGTAGLIEIKRHGGVTIAQDPADAAHPSMPRSAIRKGAVDYILPLASIGPKLVELTREPLPQRTEPKRDDLQMESS